MTDYWGYDSKNICIETQMYYKWFRSAPRFSDLSRIGLLSLDKLDHRLSAFVREV
jgi:hypothetical protein